jgi:serine O-acetyltransferase
MNLEQILSESKQDGRSSKLKVFYRIFFHSSSNSVFILRLSQLFHKKGRKMIAHYFKRKLELRYGIYVSLNCQIGLGIKFPHPTGIVIGDGVCLGEKVTIYQHVTLGGKVKGDAINGNYPKIGNNVTIFAGAKILGNVKVGDNSVIGANSVVLENVDSNSVYAGVPARKIKTLGDDDND